MDFILCWVFLLEKIEIIVIGDTSKLGGEVNRQVVDCNISADSAEP